MDLHQQFRQNVRTFYAWLGSVVLLGVSPLIALRLIERETTAYRAAGVAVGVAGMLPWMWVLVAIIRRGDEFQQRMHLVAIAIAAGVCLMLLVTLDWLQRAWFMPTPDLMLLWPGCMLIWLVALLLTKRHYERPR
jgi:hypothetical protein